MRNLNRALASVAFFEANLPKVKSVLKFVTMEDGKVCPICRPLHNSMWRANRFPKSYNPPLHYNCRCVLQGFMTKIKDKEIALYRPKKRIRTNQPKARPKEIQFEPLIVKIPPLKIARVKPRHLVSGRFVKNK